MVLATVFVTLPFVVREVVPVLREIGDEQEQAAATLGAAGWQTFWRVTLPAIRWGVAYGVVLTTARALGEFGAVSVVSGKISGETETLTLLVEKRFQNFDLAGRLRGLRAARLHRARDAARHDAAEATEGSRLMIAVERRHQALRRLRRPRRRLARRAGRLADRAARAQRLAASRRCCASSPVSRSPTAARVVIDGADATRVPAAAARRRLRLPALRRLQAHDRARQRRLRPDDPQAPEGRDRRTGRRAAGARRARRASHDALPDAALRRPAPAHGAGPGARGRAARAAARRAVRRARRQGPRGAARWLRRLHDEVHVTTCSSPTTRRRRWRSPTASWS